MLTVKAIVAHTHRYTLTQTNTGRQTDRHIYTHTHK